MPGPYRSKLIPHLDEIVAFRSTRPPTPYVIIAERLNAKYGLNVTLSAVWAFVKVRSRGRKVYSIPPVAAGAPAKRATRALKAGGTLSAAFSQPLSSPARASDPRWERLSQGAREFESKSNSNPTDQKQ